MADPFLTQVWRDLLPPLGLGHRHLQGRKPGPYRGKPPSGPTLPGESAVRPAQPCPTARDRHTQVHNLPTLREETEASSSKTLPASAWSAPYGGSDSLGHPARGWL